MFRNAYYAFLMDICKRSFRPIFYNKNTQEKLFGSENLFYIGLDLSRWDLIKYNKLSTLSLRILQCRSLCDIRNFNILCIISR